MNTRQESIEGKTLVAIDFAKRKNAILVEESSGNRKLFLMSNSYQDFQKLILYFRSLPPAIIAFEATGEYHRPLTSLLQGKGFSVRQVSTVAVSKTREALYNSWDKNDPKDAQVILHLIKTGVTQFYRDPLFDGTHDIIELSRTYFHVSKRKTRTQHTIMTHFLPLYFPEMEKYYTQSRAMWFTRLLFRFPCPKAITKYSQTQFEKEAWNVVGRKVSKRSFLADVYKTANESMGLDVDEFSPAISSFQLVLKEHQGLCQSRKHLEQQAEVLLTDSPDFHRLQTLPGVGPIIALTILGEAGDLRRFNHYRQFLKFCGLDLSTQQSGQFRGQTKLSKRGNARLRSAFWMAATIAVRMKTNTFKSKYERYVKGDQHNADLKRKAYTAVTAKMARTAYSMIKNDTDYYPYHEAGLPSGKIPSAGAVEAVMTS